MKDHKLGKLFAAGEVIFREGEVGECMYVIQKGQVKVTKGTGVGEATIAVLGEGEVFGEMALFDLKPRSATTTAFGEARVLCIDRKRLFSVVKRDPTIVFKIIKSLSDRIRRLDDKVAEMEAGKHM